MSRMANSVWPKRCRSSLETSKRAMRRSSSWLASRTRAASFWASASCSGVNTEDDITGPPGRRPLPALFLQPSCPVGNDGQAQRATQHPNHERLLGRGRDVAYETDAREEKPMQLRNPWIDPPHFS